MKKITFPLVMALLSFLIGIFACVFLIFSVPWYRQIPQVLLYFVPVIVFGIVSGICYSSKGTEKICRWISVILIPIFLIGGFFLTIYLGIGIVTQSVTDVRYYEDVVDKVVKAVRDEMN